MGIDLILKKFALFTYRVKANGAVQRGGGGGGVGCVGRIKSESKKLTVVNKNI